MISPRPFLLLAAIAVLSPAACSQVPQATSYPYSSQAKMQAMHHWDVLAADVADQVIPALAGKSVYLSPPGPDASPFQRGFHEMLATRFVSKGVAVLVADDRQAPVLEYKLQTLRHRASRGVTNRPPPGLMTTLAGGLLVLRDALDHGHAASGWKAAGLVGAVAVDALWDTSPAATDHELLVTSYIVQAGRYLFRRSDLYYINGADAWHYQERKPTPAKQIEISG